MYRTLFRLLPLAVMFVAPSAFGQYTRDTAAVRKIDEAVNQHYLATDFNKAEGILTGTVKACEDKCSPQTLAKAWMYVGIVRGSGKNDLAGAKEAFQTAIALDPEVKLDSALATAETQAAFAEVGSGGGAAAPAAAPAGAPAAEGDAAPATGGAGNMTCTPEVTEVETRRPIPVQCTSDEELTNVEVRYRSFGSETWKTLKMAKVGDSFRATIPCDANQMAGTVRLYVRGRDAGGKDVADWGSKGAPIELTTVEETKADPPAFSDAEPPARCPAKEICPPDFPGCDTGKPKRGKLDWGATCDNSSECKAGLLCIDGTCETAPSCTSNSDCSVGTCDAGKCSVDGDDDGGATGPMKKWWFGFHIAQDFAFVSGTDVCLDATQAEDDWACYLSTDQEDPPYQSADFGPPPGAAGTIAGGTAAATLRFLLSVEYALTNNITAGLRLGYAIRGGPPAGRKVDYIREMGRPPAEYTEVLDEGTPFLPIHVEGRGTYYFGSAPLARKGFRPYVQVGGGLAQVDARVVVKVKDNYELDGDENLDDGQVNAWKKLGQGFLEAGGGVQFAVSPQFALQLNLNAMFMLPASGFVLEPSLGVVYGAF